MSKAHKNKSKSINLDDNLWEQFKGECKLRNTTIIKALTEAICMWMAK